MPQIRGMDLSRQACRLGAWTEAVCQVRSTPAEAAISVFRRGPAGVLRQQTPAFPSVRSRQNMTPRCMSPWRRRQAAHACMSAGPPHQNSNVGDNGHITSVDSARPTEPPERPRASVVNRRCPMLSETPRLLLQLRPGPMRRNGVAKQLRPRSGASFHGIHRFASELGHGSRTSLALSRPLATSGPLE